MQRLFRVFILASLVVCISPLLAISQGIQQTPYSAGDVVRRSGPSVVPDLTPSNPLGFPGSSLLGPRGSENISISSGMFQGILPKIPNLQLGYNYTFGPQLKAGTASVDYLLPFKLGTDSTIYGEAHGEFQSLSIAQPGSPSNSMELCFGGGYRRMFGNHTMVGLHSFFNTAKLSGTWYPSASAGVEFASMISGHDAIDFIFNWYGKALDATIFGTTPAYAASAATATFGNANFDFQVGYSHELYNGGPDLRLSATGYKLECGSNVYGYYGGAELKSRDGVYVVKYDVGYDNANQVYQSVAAFINMGFQLENLLDGKSPFVKPKPVFQSPRNMTTLTEAKPNRNWRHTTQAATLTYLSAKAYPNCPYLATQCAEQTITVINNGTSTINALYMGFLPAANCPDPPYLDQASTYFPNWTPTTGNPNILQYNAPLATNGQVVITFPAMNRILVSISISANVLPWSQTCNVNQAEFTLGGKWAINPTAPLQDTYDISLNDGFNFPMEIKPDSGTPAMVCCSTGNSTAPGVYPLGASTCTAWDGTAANCPGPATEVHGTDAQGAPSPPCQYGVSPTNYTVYIGGIPPDVLSQSPTPTYCPNNGTTTTCTPGP